MKRAVLRAAALAIWVGTCFVAGLVIGGCAVGRCEVRPVASWNGPWPAHLNDVVAHLEPGVRVSCQ
jgi:hypothetical protein